MMAQLSKDQFPLERTFKNGFIYFAPSLTYTAPFPETSNEFQLLDTTYVINSKVAGQFRFGFEIGWYHSFDNPIFFHYLEGGIAYRSFQGSNDLSIEKRWNGLNSSSSLESEYSLETATAVFRAIRAAQLGKFSFFTFGPGINFDYHLNDNRNILTDVLDETEQDMKLQVHLQIGFGLRLTEKVIFLPQLEVPLAEVYPIGKWEASQNYADNRLYPLLLSFKIILLRNDPMNCNAPPAPKGF